MKPLAATTAYLALLFAAPCRAGDVEDYLTKEGTLKAAITLQHSAYGLVPVGGYQGELCVIEPTGEWTRKAAGTKGKLSAKQLAALAQHLATQDFNSLPIHLGYQPRAIHDGYFVRIAFGKKATLFNLEKPGDPRTDYLPKPGNPKAAAWSRFVAVELFLTDIVRLSEVKEKENARLPVGIEATGDIGLRTEGKHADLVITAERGVGQASLRLTSGEWPADVVLRFKTEKAPASVTAKVAARFQD